MSPSELHPDDLEGINAFWEKQVVDPFIRTCVRGLWKWVESLERDDISMTYKMPYYQVWHLASRSRRIAEWYFQGSRTGQGLHIHFRLLKSTVDERRALREELSHHNKQPFVKKPRKDEDKLFTFNLYNASDVEIAKRILLSRFDNL